MYAAAADAVNERMPNALHVLSHLLCTSIELTLKAHLRHVGYKEAQLRKFGHNLRDLLVEASRHGLDYTGSRSYVLSVASGNYRDRLFVYPEEGSLNVILPWRLRQMCRELICDVFPKIKGEDTFRELQSEPGIAVLSEYPDVLDASAWEQKGAVRGAT